MTNPAKQLEAAREAVVLASGVCRQVQAALNEVRAITKDDRSPVTVADFASQAIVAKTLAEHLGENVILVAEETSSFLREEGHEPHLDATLAAVRDVYPGASAEDLLGWIDIGCGDTRHHGYWTLDPIDGTKGFLRNQQYAIALAYVESGTPTLGVMGCPNLPRDLSEPLDEPHAEGCVYFALRGEGVYETGAASADDEAIRLTQLDHERGAPVCITASVEKAHSNQTETDRMLRWMEDHGEAIGDKVRIDSQCKYAVVARGQADAYLRLPTRPGYVERIWDHAAGALIASEAGSAVSDIFGRELDFSRGRGLESNTGIICAPPRLHGRLIEAVRAIGIGPA